MSRKREVTRNLDMVQVRILLVNRDTEQPFYEEIIMPKEYATTKFQIKAYLDGMFGDYNNIDVVEIVWRKPRDKFQFRMPELEYMKWCMNNTNGFMVFRASDLA